MIQFIQNNKGLKPEHLDEMPVYEKSYYPPDYGFKQVSRLYRDGSLYFFIFDDKLKNDNNEGKWGFISTVKDAAIEKIQQLLKEVNSLKSDDLESGDVKGLIRWKIPVEDQIKELITTLIPESKLEVFSEINKLVNANLNPIPSD